MSFFSFDFQIPYRDMAADYKCEVDPAKFLPGEQNDTLKNEMEQHNFPEICSSNRFQSLNDFLKKHLQKKALHK